MAPSLKRKLQQQKEKAQRMSERIERKMKKRLKKLINFEIELSREEILEIKKELKDTNESLFDFLVDEYDKKLEGFRKIND